MKFSRLSLLVLPLLLCSCSSNKSTGIDVSFVALNDFHGIVESRSQSEAGLNKVASYLIEKKKEGAILLNSGDSFQGTYFSGSDKGETISKIFKEIDFDAYTIGNHEFDWGINQIANIESYLGTKFLGANIYNYPSKTKSENIGAPYTIKTINPGTNKEIKIGIIGVIGEDQITSINSKIVEDITFVNPNPIVKDLSSELRAAGCQIVVADYHASFEQVDSEEISKCVDAVFLAHTHQQFYEEVNGVPFIQGGRNGEAVSEITLTIKNNKNVSLKSHNIQQLNNVKIDINSTISKIISDRKEVIDPIGTKVLGTTDTTINSDAMSCFYSKIAYEKVADLGYNIDFVLFNTSRYSLNQGNITYASLYDTHPFMNSLYILSVNGYSIYRETTTLHRQFGYNVHNIDIYSLQDQKSTWYDVIVFDYNGFHINVDENGNKYYDQFAASFTPAAKHAPTLIENYNVFDLAIERLEKNPTIHTSDFCGFGFINSPVTIL